jgi:hypothetical protein
VDRADAHGGGSADEGRVGDGAGEGDPAQFGAAVGQSGRGLVAHQEALVEVDGGEVAEAGDDDVEEFAGGGLQVEGVADAGAGLVQEGEIAPGGGGLAGGGAAGYEIDRYELALGTPPEALLLASSEGHSKNYPHVVEEVLFPFPGMDGTQDPQVRADLVYFTTPGDGAVFSTSSISWCGSLSHDGYSNPISRMLENVLRRFRG